MNQFLFIGLFLFTFSAHSYSKMFSCTVTTRNCDQLPSLLKEMNSKYKCQAEFVKHPTERTSAFSRVELKSEVCQLMSPSEGARCPNSMDSGDFLKGYKICITKEHSAQIDFKELKTKKGLYVSEFNCTESDAKMCPLNYQNVEALKSLLKEDKNFSACNFEYSEMTSSIIYTYDAKLTGDMTLMSKKVSELSPGPSPADIYQYNVDQEGSRSYKLFKKKNETLTAEEIEKMKSEEVAARKKSDEEVLKKYTEAKRKKALEAREKKKAKCIEDAEKTLTDAEKADKCDPLKDIKELNWIYENRAKNDNPPMQIVLTPSNPLRLTKMLSSERCLILPSNQVCPSDTTPNALDTYSKEYSEAYKICVASTAAKKKVVKAPKRAEKGRK